MPICFEISDTDRAGFCFGSHQGNTSTCHQARLTSSRQLGAATVPRLQAMSTAVSGPSGHPPLPGAGTPTVHQLERLLRANTVALSRVDEVWPSLYIGDMTAAHDRYQLWKLGITHVLNAAHKQLASSGCQDFYGAAMDYRGIAARDLPHFDISAYFYSASEYIHQAVDVLGGKVLRPLCFGYSRAATLTLAYLMIHQRLSLWEAVSTVAKHRRIYPNRGFLKQLRTLDTKLQQERKV